MICGLIDEAISLFLHKQRGQHALDLLPAGQCGKRAGQRLPAQTQAVRLAGTAPFRRIRCKGAQQLPRGQGRVRHRKREQHAGRTPAHGSAVRQPAGQQPQQRSFAPAVAPGQSQPPPGVYGKAHIFKQRIAAVIGKREMFYGNLRHTSASFQQKTAGQRTAPRKGAARRIRGFCRAKRPGRANHPAFVAHKTKLPDAACFLPYKAGLFAHLLTSPFSVCCENNTFPRSRQSPNRVRFQYALMEKPRSSVISSCRPMSAGGTYACACSTVSNSTSA